MGYLSKRDLDAHYEILSMANVKPILPANISLEKLLDYITKDNKRGYIDADKDQVGMIILKGLGRVNGNANFPITPIPIFVIKKVLSQMFYNRRYSKPANQDSISENIYCTK
jgi:hypothetical protein